MARAAAAPAAIVPVERPKDAAEKNAWWTTLRHGGVLLSPLVLEDTLPEGPARAADRDVDRLRVAYQRFRAAPEENLGAWLDAVFEDFLGHAQPNWQKGPHVGDRFKAADVTGAARKPARVLLNAMKEAEPRFLLGVDKDRVALEKGERVQALGMHGGRRAFGQFLALLRGTQVPLGVFTNGHQFRLVWVGLDTEAWAEWDAQAWFEGGEGRSALDGFRALLGADFVKPDPSSAAHPLLQAVEESRRRQADLSHVMGTQVREAVEMLLTALDDGLLEASPEQRARMMAPLKQLGLRPQEELDALYQAAIRVVMRLVVTLYAESRELFPNSQEAYLDSYGVDGLFLQLQRAKIEEGEQALAQQFGAWARLRSLSRLVYHGSHHGQLTMQGYGGQLFQPPQPGGKDPVQAALAVLENADASISDAVVCGVLERLRVGKFKMKGRGWRKGPVDFSDLRTEYIGMMYEGLLDYQLREARAEDGGIVVLNLGDQPALPLKVLTSLSDERLKKLISELKKKTKGAVAEEDGADEGDEDEGGEDGSDDEAESEAAEDAEDEPEAAEGAAGDGDNGAGGAPNAQAEDGFDAQVMAWAERAVRLNPQLFLSAKARREREPGVRRKAEQKAARGLVLRRIRPGATYLVRWSGTRKGTGTFYTKPALAVPTVNRTLEPLAYNVAADGTKTPKTPDEILALKVCDPAMGSGSFLVAALRYLTRALADSFEVHVFQRTDKGAPLVTPLGTRSEGLYRERLVPLRRGAQEGAVEDYAARLEAELKRAVVEHCIYGVDLHPLAVELGKLSLWVETMEAQLTFAFLDHKLKCGNSLIGAWQVQAEHYPLGAWERELGDGKDNPRTKRLQRIRKELIVPEMRQILEQYDIEGDGRNKKASKVIKAIPGQLTLAGESMQPVQARFVNEEPVVVKKRRVTSITAPAWDAAPGEVAAYTRDVYAKLHDTFDPTEQEATYRRLLCNEGYQRQKFLLDMWCAAWFWPIGAPLRAPLDAEPILTPSAYYSEREKVGTLSREIHSAIQIVAEQRRFFHWEVEYPEVFDQEIGRFGFDAVFGNPPWEAPSPQPTEFFLRYDPGYAAMDARQKDDAEATLLAQNAAIAAEWEAYNDYFSTLKHYLFCVADPATGTEDLPSLAAQKFIALRRLGRSRTPEMYRLLKGNANLYKAFAELSLGLARTGGGIGIITPQGMYQNKDTLPLRSAFAFANALEYAYSFENSRLIFDIHPMTRFTVSIVRKGASPRTPLVRFMAPDTADWEADAKQAFPYPLTAIERFSPTYRNFIEVPQPKDLQILEKMYSSGLSLSAWCAPATAGRDLMTSAHAKLTIPFGQLEGPGQRPGEWRVGNEDYLSVYEGSYIHQFDFSFEHDVPGPSNGNRIRTQSAIRKSDYARVSTLLGHPRLSIRRKAASANLRTAIAAITPDLPGFESVLTFKEMGDIDKQSTLCSILNSYAFDYSLRFRVENTVSWYILSEAPMPEVPPPAASELMRIVASINLDPACFENDMLGVKYVVERDRRVELMEEIDWVVAQLYHLSDNDMRSILRPDNSDPRNLWRDYCERLKVLEAAGKRGRWYTLEEAREIRRKAGMKVDF